jgi:hypothetical protein
VHRYVAGAVVLVEETGVVVQVRTPAASAGPHVRGAPPIADAAGGAGADGGVGAPGGAAIVDPGS